MGKRKRNARGSLVAGLPSKDRTVLLAIKSGFAFSFGFVNVVIFLLTRRFNTLMTGNTIALAMEARDWMGEDMLFTASLIILFIAGGAAYDAFSIGIEDRDGCRGWCLRACFVAAMVLSGVAADVIQFATRSCSLGEVGGPGCAGRHLYFLSPPAFLTGIVTSYLSAHPDGIITNLITGHMKVAPKALITYALTGNRTLLEKGRTSATIAAVYFCGSLAGSFASGPILTSYSWGHFTPVFTIFGCVMATLCSLHYTLCEEFCTNYELERMVVQEIRGSMIMHRMPVGRRNSVEDVRSMMVQALSSRMLSQADEGGRRLSHLEVPQEQALSSRRLNQADGGGRQLSHLKVIQE